MRDLFLAEDGWQNLGDEVQDAYVERLFDDERRTDPPVVKEADVVALLEAHLRGDEAAINNLIDATNEGDLFEATVGFLVAAFGEEEVAGVLREWHRHASG